MSFGDLQAAWIPAMACLSRSLADDGIFGVPPPPNTMFSAVVADCCWCRCWCAVVIAVAADLPPMNAELVLKAVAKGTDANTAHIRRLKTVVRMVRVLPLLLLLSGKGVVVLGSVMVKVVVVVVEPERYPVPNFNFKVVSIRYSASR